MLVIFLIFYAVTAVLIWLFDPAVKSLGDSLWYCFVSFTTIGFGDLTVSSAIGKLLTILLTLYGILVVAFIPGIIVSYVTEFNKLKANESVLRFLDKLEHLDQLSEEERRKIAVQVRQKRYRL